MMAGTGFEVERLMLKREIECEDKINRPANEMGATN
jgi:hypothetical protein